MPRDYDDYDRDDDVGDLDIRRRRGSPGEVPNYLTQAILVTLCCCLPFGIAAIVHAAKVNGHLANGDYELAVKASEEAKKWCWVSFVLGIIGNSLYLAFRVMGEGGGIR